MRIETFTVLSANAKNKSSRATKLLMLTRDKLEKVLVKHPEYILDLKDTDRELRHIALQEDPTLITSLNAPSEEDYLDAVRLDAMLLSKIKNPTVKVINEALRQRGDAIQFVSNPTKEMVKLAVVSEPLCIQFLKNIDPDVQTSAVRGNGLAIEFIENPNETLQLAAVKGHPAALRVIKNPTKRVIAEAITAFPTSIEFVAEPDEQLQILAIEKSEGAVAFHYINKPTKKVQQLAYFKNKKLLPNLSEPSEEVQLDAITVDPMNIQYIDRPTKNVQLKLVTMLNSNPDLFDFVDKIHPAAMKEYRKFVAFSDKSDRSKSNLPSRDEVKYLTQDQLAVLRYMDTKHLTKLPVHELRRQPWSATPFFKRLAKIAKNQEITRANILKLSTEIEPKTQFGNMLIEQADFAKYKFEDGDNKVFDVDANCFVVYVDSAAFEDYTLPKPVIKALNDFIEKGEPPHLSGLLTASYVQYTAFRQDIWIDGVETGLMDILPKAERKDVFWLYIWTLNNFIREMRHRGYQKFYMPSKSIRTMIYGDKDNPLYDALPREAMFTEAIVKGIDPLVNSKEAWVLAASK